MRSLTIFAILLPLWLAIPGAAHAQTVPSCVGLSLPTGMICRSDLQCTFPVAMATGGRSVGSLTAHLADNVGLTCPACVAGASASNGQCTIIEDTCNLQVVDLVAPFTAFSSGTVAEVTIDCTTQGIGELCAFPISAFAPDGITEHPTCEPSCVPYACRSCMSGDCNGNERRDGGDTICAARCMIGLASPGSNCGCGTDCNCLGGTEASDITCTILRNLEAFGRDTGDTCDVPAPASLAFVQETAASKVRVRVGRTRATRSGRRHRAFVVVRGDAAEQVGAVRLTLSTDSGLLGRMRLTQRLAKAGFDVEVHRTGDRNAVAVIVPPATLPLPAVGSGRVLRVVVSEDSFGLTVGHAELGSTSGLPMSVEGLD